ncbi:type 1 glutamine amidotransferase domain-containing protein [Thorsellia anophelis]|uniref:Intracellular protease/amidase n=1 Tax=Thorsellia anophelis DSM 18579 TaxID=1123402 RepID=A0A1I0E818_9GAMM|nr:type 1 glutamine amidotransferase domain-containing protein [Thorsellia anophelis]SET40575.1 Putative intracellular protease/amidase [Thorsellia anophelis DSM 18579]
MKILMVLTSHAQLGNTDIKTGFWLEEFTTPYYVFKDAGADITIASPKGGLPPIDPNSAEEQTDSTVRYHADNELKKQLANTLVLSQIDAGEFDAIFYPGGHGPLWDLAEDKDSIALIESFYQQNKPIGAVCHGPAVLKHPKSQAGDYIVAGKDVTGFSNEEEEAVKLTEIVPFLVEDMLKANGGNYIRAANWQSYVAVNPLLVTGQNPASSEATATELLKVLSK